MTSSSLFLELPAECTLQILKRLPVADVVATSACCTATRQLVSDDCFWAELAEAKWGAAVRDLKALADADADQRQAQQADGDGSTPTTRSWQSYCYKRMSAKTIWPSPLSLGQEQYPDPWQHIISCTLCSRTSGGAVIRNAIATFFEVLPTPTAVLQASDDTLLELLHPLGLQANRMTAVKSVSHGFLSTDWLEPSEFKGCGKFVTDSWRIFCKGHRDSKGVADTNLKQYLSWYNRQQRVAAAGQQQQQQQEEADSPSAPAQQRKQRQQQQQRMAAGPGIGRQTRRASLAAAAAAAAGTTTSSMQVDAAAAAAGVGAARRMTRAAAAAAAGSCAASSTIAAGDDADAEAAAAAPDVVRPPRGNDQQRPAIATNKLASQPAAAARGRKAPPSTYAKAEATAHPQANHKQHVPVGNKRAFVAG